MRISTVLILSLVVACGSSKLRSFIPIGSPCSSGGVCASNGVCANGVCRPACAGQSACGAHESCLSGACIPVVCGDGVIMGDEICDDANTKSSDGCSSTCQVEPVFACSGEPSHCVPCSDPDPLNCTLVFHYTEWGPWDDCNPSCGAGSQGHTRQCIRSDGNFVDCAYCGGICSGTQACNAGPCPPHYTDWSPWTACVNSTQTRNRHCESPEGDLVDCAGCGGQCNDSRTCMPCESYGRNVVNCDPTPPGNITECNRVLAEAHTACLEAGCQWSGATACLMSGSPSSTVCYGGVGSCQ